MVINVASVILVALRAGEMAQKIRALVALSEVLSSEALSSIPSNHIVAHNHL